MMIRRPSAATFDPVEDSAEREAIMTAITRLDPNTSSEWNHFANAVPGAKVDAIEPHSIFKAGEAFQASATVYVSIPGASTASIDSFPANIVGRLTANNQVEIDSFNLRTSSFFGDSAFTWQSKTS